MKKISAAIILVNLLLQTNLTAKTEQRAIGIGKNIEINQTIYQGVSDTMYKNIIKPLEDEAMYPLSVGRFFYQQNSAKDIKKVWFLI